MVVVTGKYPQAQLVGLQGLATLSPTVRTAAMPPGIQAQVRSLTPTIYQDSAAGKTFTGVPVCVPGVSTPCTCVDGTSGTRACTSDGMSYAPCACGKKVNWLLYGGIALAAVVAWKVLR